MDNKDNITEVDANEVYNMHLSNHIKVIDIREPYEHRDITMNGTLNIPMNQLISNVDMYMKKDEIYYLLCNSGSRSYHLTKILVDNGYNVINAKGGIISIRELKRFKS